MIVRVTKKHTSTKSLKDSVHRGRIKPAALCVIQTLQGRRKSSECVCVCVCAHRWLRNWIPAPQSDSPCQTTRSWSD